MRISCSGCRALRKGCTENCSIRPCLQWIKNSESQANATVFLAKFYGRAGLLNLINGGPDHLRPDIFRSLLYEACGRIVNPIFGSVGLLWSGSWHLCEAAVDAVLNGAPISQIPADFAARSNPVLPLRAYDIRHVSNGPSADLHKVAKTRTRFKRSAHAGKSLPESGSFRAHPVDFNPAGLYGLIEPAVNSGENESMLSVETVEASHVSQAEPNKMESGAGDEGDVGIDLTLGLAPPARFEMSGWVDDTCRGPRAPA